MMDAFAKIGTILAIARPCSLTSSDSPAFTRSSTFAVCWLSSVTETAGTSQNLVETSTRVKPSHRSGRRRTRRGPVFSINGYVYPEIEELIGMLGSVEEWSIVNTTEMITRSIFMAFASRSYPTIGATPEVRAWRDTVSVRAETTTRLRIPLEEHSGIWMFHCHILEHAARGMMGELQVQP